MQKYIGGFFELELPQNKYSYHTDALALTNGRACVNLFLNSTKPKRVYVPSYTCDALFEPMIINKIEYIFYDIDINLKIVSLPVLAENEYIIYINYFGLKRKYTKELHQLYNDKLLVDNTHDFFSKEYKNNWSFTSTRKYFGVPDGAYLYSPQAFTDKFERNTNISLNHLFNRLTGNQHLAYAQYVEYEKSLNSEIKQISEYSEKILSAVNYNEIKKRRQNNFKYLHDKLQKFNMINWTLNDDDVPFCYPFLPKVKIEKSYFYEKNIFIPSLWQDPISRSNAININTLFAETMLPFPIDHRYCEKELSYIVDITTKRIQK